MSEVPTYRLGGYREYGVPADLADIADRVWIYSRPRAAAWTMPPGGHRILPEPGVSLCFQTRRRADGPAIDPELIVIGPVRAVRSFDPGPEVHLECVRIKPEWSRDLLRADPAEQADGLNPLAAIAASRAPALLDRLARTASSFEAVGVLLDALRTWRESFHPARSAVLAHRVLERLRSPDRDPLRFGVLARALNVSERHLHRSVVETVGIRPKYLDRLGRLGRTVTAADGQAAPDWSALAAEGGYYDQSHMIHEFLSLTGTAPAELHAERQAQVLGMGSGL